MFLIQPRMPCLGRLDDARASRYKPRVRRESQGRWILAAVAVLAGLGVGLWRWHSRSRIEHSQDEVILAAARRYGVDPALVKAVIWRESGFDPNARGRAGEIGLMQVTDPAAQEWAEAARVYPVPEAHLFDPRTNVLAGTWYLAKLIRRYAATDDPLPFALADYNAGRRNVLKWMQGDARQRGAAFRAAIGFESTRRYVDSVLARRTRYGEGGRLPRPRRSQAPRRRPTGGGRTGNSFSVLEEKLPADDPGESVLRRRA